MLALYMSDIFKQTNSPEERNHQDRRGLNGWVYRVHNKTERG